jgi:NAD-dependent deacetylase
MYSAGTSVGAELCVPDAVRPKRLPELHDGAQVGTFFVSRVRLSTMTDDAVDEGADGSADNSIDGTADDIDGDALEAVASEIAAADHAVALTGAGVSTASGIPDFRSEGGIWDEFDPAEFHYSRFQADPAGFWDRRVDMHEFVYGGDVEPNAAHRTLATLEKWGHLDVVITQNIDGLHGAAGSESVVELHGNAERVVCDACGRRTDAGPVRERVEDGELPPRCECGGVLKPDVVLFGEQLPEREHHRAREHARVADVFLAVGSSLSVQPAASLPRTATRTGGTLAIVNLESTAVSSQADYEFRADVTDVLPALVDAVR